MSEMNFGQVLATPSFPAGFLHADATNEINVLLMALT